MDGEGRKAAFKRALLLIELACHCDGENPLMAGHLLRELEAQLAKEEQGS
jgi:hypothetical protein